MDFIQELRFDRLGAFTFSFEAGTFSETLGDPIPEELKLERQARLMETQQQISLELNQAQIGKTLDVLIEGLGDIEGTDEKIAVGRTYRDAPEIDGVVLVEGQPEVGSIIPVEISNAMTNCILIRLIPIEIITPNSYCRSAVIIIKVPSIPNPITR